jgi:hypothetical protein
LQFNDDDHPHEQAKGLETFQIHVSQLCTAACFSSSSIVVVVEFQIPQSLFRLVHPPHHPELVPGPQRGAVKIRPGDSSANLGVEKVN